MKKLFWTATLGKHVRACQQDESDDWNVCGIRTSDEYSHENVLRCC